MCQVADRDIEIMEALLCKDNDEVAHFFAGYVARKTLKYKVQGV